MACRLIPVGLLVRRTFLKRRFTFGVLLASLPFVGYLLLFSSETGRSTSVSGKILPTKIVCDCHGANEQQPQNNVPSNQQTEAVVTSTTKTVEKRKVEHETVKSDGSLNVHTWSDICGKSVDILRNWPNFPYFPDKRSFVSEFRKTEVANVENSGERIFGFVHPQVSGMYTFVITSDNNTSELWLSSNEDPVSSEMIARVYSPQPPHGSAWTVKGDYKKYPDQISKEILLHAGKKYYIESLSKQGSGAAHVAVYWSYENSTFEIISSKYLQSFSQENADYESIPPHSSKHSKTTLKNKSYLYYLNRLPFLSRKEYINLIPTCPYSPSFLVRGKLKRYLGVKLTNLSQVFPQDETDMSPSGQVHPEDEWFNHNALVNNNTAKSVIGKFMNLLQSRKYFLKKIHKLIHKPDPNNGDRFLLNLELGLDNTNQSFRLSEHVYQEKGNDTLCLPEGINWNNSATVYFILPVKEQGGWVYHFINQLTETSLLTGDTNFHVIIVDFESKDIDMGKAFNTSLLSSRHTIVSLTGKFYKTLALNKAVEQVPNAHDIVFLFDLHIDVPADIMESIRMNTIAGRMAYFPVVGRLDCGSSSVEPTGFWQLNGYGLLAIYKSDWDRFGGMNIKDYQYKWGGEDWDLLDRVLMLAVEVERIKHPGLYHHFHSRKRSWN